MGTISEAIFEEEELAMEEMTYASVKLNREINLLEEVSILTSSSNMCSECLRNKMNQQSDLFEQQGFTKYCDHQEERLLTKS